MPEGLRSLGEQLGIPVDSDGLGGPPAVRLARAGRIMAPVLLPEQRPSLAAMLARARLLPEIRLEAELLSGPGEAPLQLRVRVSAQDGLVLSTRLFPVQGGRGFGPSPNALGAGGDLPGLSQLGPGDWQLVVRRDGVGPGGFVRRERSFALRVTAPPAPAPPPPPPAPRPVPPTITARAEPTAEGLMVRVTGTGFLPRLPADAAGVAVRLVDAVRLQDSRRFFTGSRPDGSVDALVGPVVVDTLLRNSLGQALVAVSAADSRTDPASTPSGQPLWSNTVTLAL